MLLAVHDISYIVCNFRGAKYLWFLWRSAWPQIFYPRMKWPCLPLPAVQTATTKILPTKCLNISEPRIFYPPKITRYTVVDSHAVTNLVFGKINYAFFAYYSFWLYILHHYRKWNNYSAWMLIVLKESPICLLIIIVAIVLIHYCNKCLATL